MAKDMLTEVQRNLPMFSTAERRVADRVMSEPEEVLRQAISELAASAGTSVATVVRFCQRLNFPGYGEFRRELAGSLGREQVSLEGVGLSTSEFAAHDALEDIIAKLVYAETRALQSTGESIDPRALGAIALAVARAGRVLTYGVATSGLAARDLHQKLHRLGVVSHFWDDLHIARMSAAGLTPRDVAIAFSHSGATPEIDDVLSKANARGAVTVLITNTPAAPAASHAQQVLTTNAAETTLRPGAMSGRIAQLAVVDFLFVAIAKSLQNEALGNLTSPAP